MNRASVLQVIVVVVGLGVGYSLPSVLGLRLIQNLAPEPSAPLAAPTVAPAVTFTPAPSPTTPGLTSPTPSAAATVAATGIQPSPTLVPSAATSPTVATSASTSAATPSIAPPSPAATVESATTPAASPSAEASPSAGPTPVVYVVQSGDTLLSIGRRFGVSPDAIISANGLSDPNHLSEGQKLIIPPK